MYKYKKSLKNLVYGGLLIALCIFQACQTKKQDPQPTTTAQEKATDSDNQATSQFDAMADVSQNALDNTQIQGRTSGSIEATNGTYPNVVPCAIVTVSGGVPTPTGTGTFVRTIVIDFGTAGTCVSPDGRKRKGKIIITYPRPASLTAGFNPFNVVGTVVTTTFENHFVDGIKVEGTHLVTCVSFSINTTSAGFTIARTQRVQVNNGKLTLPTGGIHLWSCDRRKIVNLTLTQAFVLNPAASSISVWGTHQGTTPENVQYAGSVLENESLLWKLECATPAPNASTPPPAPFPVKGKMTLTATNHPPAVLDFGNGTCDRIYTLTVNGQTFTATAP